MTIELAILGIVRQARLPGMTAEQITQRISDLVESNWPRPVEVEHVFAGDGIEDGMTRLQLLNLLTDPEYTGELIGQFRGQEITLVLDPEDITATVGGFTTRMYDRSADMCLAVIRFLDDIIDLIRAEPTTEGNTP